MKTVNRLVSIQLLLQLYKSELTKKGGNKEYLLINMSILIGRAIITGRQIHDFDELDANWRIINNMVEIVLLSCHSLCLKEKEGV